MATISIEGGMQKSRRTFSLYWTVNVVMSSCRIRVFVVGNVVDLALLEKLWCDDPWSVRDNFICPFAVTDVFTSAAR
jgi:hypothetical protein